MGPNAPVRVRVAVRSHSYIPWHLFLSYVLVQYISPQQNVGEKKTSKVVTSASYWYPVNESRVPVILNGSVPGVPKVEMTLSIRQSLEYQQLKCLSTREYLEYKKLK